jgi:3',5'-cyclic AMP phosphodiesterase CpdA
MASVRILHASDLHIAKQENVTSPADRVTPGTLKSALFHRMFASSHDPAILQRLASFIHKESAKGLLDAVILTGDIATTGATGDLEKAFEFIHEAADPRVPTQSARQKGKATLAGANKPIWLLPGNHDRYQSSIRRFYVPGGLEFDRVFRRDWQGPVQRFPSIAKAGLTVTVIGADLNLQTHRQSDRRLGWLGQGLADPFLNQLEAATKQLTEAERQCVIWAVHFPPLYPNISPYLKLLDDNLLVARANACGIKAVLSGHTHSAVRYRKSPMRFDVLCAGTVSQSFAPEGNQFQIIEVSSDASGNINIANEEYVLRGFAGGKPSAKSEFRRA